MNKQASKKEIQSRERLLCRIVRENPGLTVPQISERAKIEAEKMRYTLMQLLTQPTKRGFRMYKQGRCFYTTKAHSGTTQGHMKAPRPTVIGAAKKSAAIDTRNPDGTFKKGTDPRRTLEVPTDAKKHQEAQKIAVCNDEWSLERLMAPLRQNASKVHTRMHQFQHDIDAIVRVSETYAEAYHELKEEVLDFLDSLSPLKSLRELVGERPKTEGGQ